MSPHILIAGGGIGGLTTALSLHQQGIPCEIFEKATHIEHRGVAIQLTPNAMHIFQKLGINKQIEAISFEPNHVRLQHFANGKMKLIIPLKDICQQRYGAKYLHIHRAELQNLLYKFIQQAGIAFHLSHQAINYEQTDNHVTLLTNKGKYQGDILIASDGVKSVIRQIMYPKETLRFTGKIAWRGMIETKALSRKNISPDVNIWLGEKKHFVAYHIHKGEHINFVAVKTRNSWTEEKQKVQGDISELRHNFREWDKQVTDLLEACQKCFLWGLFDHLPLQKWSQGRTVLLGDAAHPMLPFMAQGAAQAIEDAYILAQEIAHTPHHIVQALIRYETRRKPRSTMIQSLSEKNGKTYHATGLQRYQRDIGFAFARQIPSLMRHKLDKVYGYNTTE